MSLAASSISTWSLYKSESLFSCNYYGDARLVMMQEYQLFDANVICYYSMPSMYITDWFPEVSWEDEEPRELVLKPINE